MSDQKRTQGDYDKFMAATRKKKIMPFELSPQMTKELKRLVDDFAKDVKQQMEMASIDHMSISLDFNFQSTGPLLGVRIRSYKHQENELLYDQDVQP